MFPQGEFAIDLDKREVRCPAGQTTGDYRSGGEGQGGRFVFAAATCQDCSLRSQCVRGKESRTLTIQEEEGLQQRARGHSQSAAGRKSLRQRVVVEHRIAQPAQLGIRQSQYFGRTQTCLQVVMAAVVANLSLVEGYCKRQAKLAAIPSAEAVLSTNSRRACLRAAPALCHSSAGTSRLLSADRGLIQGLIYGPCQMLLVLVSEV